MSNLLGLLGLGSRSFTAHSAGVAVVGNNVSNVSTEGYMRQSVMLNADVVLGGVRAESVRRAQDDMLSMQERNNAGSFGFSSSTATALSDLDTSLALGPTNIAEAFSGFFGALLDLSSAPLDPNLAQQAVFEAEGLADAFSEAAQAAKTSADNSQYRAASLAAEANDLAAAIAEANETLAVTDDPTLADKRDLAASQLAELIGGRGRIDPDGNMRFVTDGGAVMVDGTRASTLEIIPNAGDPTQMQVEMVDGNHRQDVTDALGSGRIAGEISFLRGPVSDAIGAIDQLAFDFANATNAVHSANQSSDGTTGLDMFVVGATPDGAAAALSVNTALVDDPGLVATAGLGTEPADTSGLNALIDLKDQSIAGGGQRTAIDEAVGILSTVGHQTQEAEASLQLDSARGNMLSSMRDSLSGVSIEEEMVRLSEFQRAAQAATTYVATIDEMLSNLLATL